ncbi:MAG: cyclic nucleotide-binding domain-containing protein [Desulfomonilia bacterium]
MNKHSTHAPGPRDILREAERTALRGDEKKALELYETCIGEYMSRGMPFKAIAAAKNARTLLGATPKVQSLIIRLYASMNLHGDVREELSHSASSLKKDEISLLRIMGQDEFLDLLEIIEIMTVPKGHAVFRQHDTGEDIFIIISGAIDVLRDNKRLTVLGPGDIFGELGFFHHARRSATLAALKKSMILKIPAGPLRGLCRKYPRVYDILEELYTLRMLKKASEDLGMDAASLYDDAAFSRFSFGKGQDIPIVPGTNITLVKHGIVEINYDERGLPMKRFLKPGSIIHGSSFRLRAHTDVEIVQTQSLAADARKNPGNAT